VCSRRQWPPFNTLNFAMGGGESGVVACTRQVWGREWPGAGVRSKDILPSGHLHITSKVRLFKTLFIEIYNFIITGDTNSLKRL
jgi:hypothetical protein